MLLKQLAKDLGVDDSIIFAGQQKNIDTFYRQASFFCMSSRFEGLPMVLLEAQSYGLPIVAFDCDTGPAEIIRDNVNGKLVERENIDKLAQVLLSMSKESSYIYSDMVHNSILSAKNWSLDKICIKWFILISNL